MMSTKEMLWTLCIVLVIAIFGPTCLIILDLVSVYGGVNITLFPDICEETAYLIALDVLIILEIGSAVFLYIGVFSRTFVSIDGSWSIYLWGFTQIMLILLGIAGIYIYSMWAGIAVPVLRLGYSLAVFLIYVRGMGSNYRSSDNDDDDQYSPTSEFDDP